MTSSMRSFARGLWSVGTRGMTRLTPTLTLQVKTVLWRFSVQ